MRHQDLNMETVLSPAFCRIWENSLLGVMIIDRMGVIHFSLNLQTSQNLVARHQHKKTFARDLPRAEVTYTFESLIGKDHRFQNAVTQALRYKIKKLGIHVVQE